MTAETETVTVAAVERRPFQIDGVLDIETSAWDRYVLSATYDGGRPRIWYSGDAMIDYIRRRGGVWWSHAGGIFDLLYILERARVRGLACQVDRSQHRVTRIVMGKATFRDSYSLWPVPLDDICGALGRPTPHLPWKCICGLRTCPCGKCGGCGGFCQIGSRAKQGDPDLAEYCKADCRALYDGLTELAGFATTHKIALRGTLGQTA